MQDSWYEKCHFVSIYIEKYTTHPYVWIALLCSSHMKYCLLRQLGLWIHYFDLYFAYKDGCKFIQNSNVEKNGNEYYC